MLPLIPALLLVLQASVPAAPADAYLDEGARELVRLARERGRLADRSITAYRALARERLSVGVRALRRDRVLFRREIAARVFWRRDGMGHVELLGAREVVPVAAPGPRVPGEPGRAAARLAFEPDHSGLLRGLSSNDGSALRHPLAEGAEHLYRYATGETTRIRLSENRTLRLVELRVLPRDLARAPLRGSIWLDLDTHAAVRAAFHLVRPVNLLRAVDDDREEEDVPGILRPLELDLRYLTIDYGLWEGRWWLPRLTALEGEARVGGMARLPVRFERSYADFEVQGEGSEARLAVLADSIDADTAGLEADASDPASAGERHVEIVHGRRRCEGCPRFRVTRPPDSLLLGGAHLPGSIYSQGESLVSDRELEEMLEVRKASVPGHSPWQRPEVRTSLLSPWRARYNRVEGLSLAARADAELGPITADATLRLGTADREPGVEVGAGRGGFDRQLRVAGYRRLAAVDSDARALGPGSSLSALLFGRDDADYYRAAGLELSGATRGAAGWDARWRLYAERQSAAEKRTDFSLRDALGGSSRFADNLVADRADQLGGMVVLGATRGLDPRGVRWSGEASLLGSTGDFTFGRPALRLGTGFPLPGRVVGALEVAGGTGFGAVPVQSEWFVGGPSTVRGYGAESRLHGPSFWRGRAEVGTAAPGGRLVLFSDAGWAGERAAFTLDPPLLSAGVGASVLDGLVRLDLARALRGDGGWRLDLHLDAPL